MVRSLLDTKVLPAWRVSITLLSCPGRVGLNGRLILGVRITVGSRRCCPARLTSWLGCPRRSRLFHPESIGTEHGHQLLRNFAELTRRWRHDLGVRPGLSVRPAESDPAGMLDGVLLLAVIVPMAAPALVWWLA